MDFWAGVAIGACLALLAVALTLGLGMVMYRAWLDSNMGHAWIEDWQETLRRWRR